MKIFFSFLFLLCAPGILVRAGEEHSLHLSLCELRFNESSSTFEVAIKIFIDDLELAIEKEGIKGLKIGADKEDELVDEHIAAYLDKYFIIDVDGNKLKGHFLGKEISDDLIAVWCYVEFPKKSSASKKCTLTNKVLLDIYDDQRNIMDIRMSKSHKDYAIFEEGKSSWTYTY